ncbi:MAG: lactonase family protein [Verrucomicrobiaceae bacterium]
MRKILASIMTLAVAQAATIPVLIGSGAGGIYYSELNQESGELSPAKKVADQPGGGWLMLRPDKKVVFSTAKVDGKGGASAWKIEGDKLSLINAVSYPGKGFCQLSVDGTSRMLMGADYGGGCLASFPLTEEGKIGEHVSFFEHQATDVREAPQNQSRVHATWPGPNNEYVYVPDLGIDRVKIYKMDPASAKLSLSGEGVSPKGSGPRHMKFSKDGKFAYVLNELTLSVTVFRRDAWTGGLSEVQTVSVFEKDGPDDKKEDKMSCSEILVSKNGRFVYTGNRDLVSAKRDSVSVLEVQEDGTLKHLQTVSSGVWIVRNIALSPEGDYLLASGQSSNEVSVIKVDTATGKMKPTGNSIEVPVAMCVVYP